MHIPQNNIIRHGALRCRYNHMWKTHTRKETEFYHKLKKQIFCYLATWCDNAFEHTEEYERQWNIQSYVAKTNYLIGLFQSIIEGSPMGILR